MKVILLKDVAKLGHRFDTKEVSSGYALNMLIPRGMAVAATAEAVKRLEQEKKKAEGERKVHADLLEKNLKDIEKVTLTIAGKTNEKGHLFAGLHKEAIAEQLFKQTQLQIDSSFIQLEQPIKETGEHVLTVAGGGKSVKLKLNVVAA